MNRRTSLGGVAVAFALGVGLVTAVAAPVLAADATTAPRAQVGYSWPVARGLVDNTGEERSVEWLRHNGVFAENATKLYDGSKKLFVENSSLSVQWASQSEWAGGADSANGLAGTATINGSQVTGSVASAVSATKATSLASGGTVDGSQITGSIAGSQISGAVASATSAGKADKLLNKDGVNYSSAGDLQVASASTAAQANLVWNGAAYDWATNLTVAKAINADNVWDAYAKTYQNVNRSYAYGAGTVYDGNSYVSVTNYCRRGVTDPFCFDPRF